MSNWNQPTGYEVDVLDDDRLYPQRSPSSTIRFRPIHTSDVSSQAVTHPRRQQLRTGNQYDEVNYFIRTRPKGATRSQRPRTTEEHPHTQREDGERDADELETQPPLRPSVHADLPRLRRSGYFGLGMVALIVLGIAGTLVLNWWNGYQDDLHYGYPRTYQTDARVGHNDAGTPSHFIALNLHHQIEVIEFPGGDASKAKVYLGPTLLGQDSDRVIVTVSFKDVNGDGKPDMILDVNGGISVFINDNGAFQTVRADDHIKM